MAAAAAKKTARKFNPSLHPRDSKGRFTKSSTRVLKGSDRVRAKAAVTGLKPADIGGQAAAQQWLDKAAGSAPAPDSAIGQYLAGGWRETNPAIRREKTPPPGVEEIDAEFGALPGDVMLRRQVPAAMFAHIPINQLVDMKVRDAAYASTGLDHPEAGPAAADTVVLHIAAPAGTSAYINAPEGEVLLARDTEVAIARAEPNGQGGWDLYGVVILRKDAPTGGGKAGDGGPDGKATPAADGSAADVTPDGGGDSGAADSRPDGPDQQAVPSAPTAAAGTAVPADGAMAAITDPLDRERIRVAVEDYAATIWWSPLIGGNRDNVGRYVAEGHLGPLTTKYGLSDVWLAVLQVVDDRPDLLTRSNDEAKAAAAARAARAEQHSKDAAAAVKAGDYRAALDQIGQGERLAPDARVGSQRSWNELRGIVRRKAEQAGVNLDDEWAGEEPASPAAPEPAAGIAVPTPDPGQPATPAAADGGGQAGPTPPAVTPTASGTSAPTAAAVPGTAGADQQLDILGGSTDYVPPTRAEAGLPPAVKVGRDTGPLIQQLGMFDVSDQKQFEGQTALLDSLLRMPETEASAPPPTPPAAPAAGQLAPVSAVPDDLSDWSDEQLAQLFRTASAGDAPDVDGLRRIHAEWERREQAMQALAASVPDDLTGLPDAEVESLYARLTAELGTLDDATVARVGAELDRRDQAAADERANAPKRALLARPIVDLTDEEIETAAGYAADLGDEQALRAVYAEWDRREQAAEAAAEQARAEQAERDRAAAEDAAAQASADAERERTERTLAAARAAAIIPPVEDSDVRLAATVLQRDGLRQVLGDDVVDRWQEEADKIADRDSPANWSALMAQTLSLSPDDRVRLAYAAADVKAAPQFATFTDNDLDAAAVRARFASGLDWEQQRERGMVAARERNRRKLAALRNSDAEKFRRFQLRALSTPVADLTDEELSVAPVMLADLHEPELVARLDDIRGEADRRHADAAQAAAAKAAGPAGPVRYTNPVARLAEVELWGTAGNSGYRGAEAGRRLAEAKRRAYGLPDDADDKAVREAARKDLRPLPDQAAHILAWYRHLGQFADLGDTPADWARGWADDPDVLDTPDPLPPANVAKPDEVWKQIQAAAGAEAADGDFTTAARFLRAIARAYRVPFDRDTPATREALAPLQQQISAAIRGDQRTPKQRAALFIAELRRLADEDGVDPADTLHYGPPDRGGKKTTGQGVWRSANAEQQQRIDALLAKGWSYMDAYADVMGVDADALRRPEAGSEKDIKQAYAEHVELQYKAAEAATAGNLLNKKAAGRGVDARKLFSGPWATAKASASEELLRFWADNPRMTYADFKASLVGGAEGRVARERMIAAGKGNQFV